MPNEQLINARGYDLMRALMACDRCRPEPLSAPATSVAYGFVYSAVCCGAGALGRFALLSSAAVAPAILSLAALVAPVTTLLTCSVATFVAVLTALTS